MSVARVAEKGSILRWLNGPNGPRWGHSPDDFDAGLAARTVERMGALFGEGRYFGLEVQGLENVPEAPAMMVSNHSGGTTIPDVWGFMVAWYRRFGTGRPLHPMAHEMVLGNQVTGPYFAKRGVLVAGRERALQVLRSARRDVMVMPGGDLDTWRPYSKRYEVRFGGRTGYARVALEAGAPIVPVANAGAHETLIVLTDGRAIARALRLPRLARAEVWPIHLSLPWGLAIGPFPHLPVPARLRYRVGAPILPPASWVPGEVPSEELVLEHDRRVRAAVQGLLDELKASRSSRRARP